MPFTAASTRVSDPSIPPTVVFHELEEPEPEPELTWDASRGTGGDVSSSSSAATARMRGFSLERLSDNVLHDTRRAHARASRAGWDVGERPAARMAYIEYPADARVAPVEAATRHALAYNSAEHRTEPKYAERARRLRQTRVLGWGSSPTAAYAPLGPPEDESRLGPNRFVLKAREAITVVEPALAAVSLFADELKPTELTRGVCAPPAVSLPVCVPAVQLTRVMLAAQTASFRRSPTRAIASCGRTPTPPPRSSVAS